MLIGKSEYPPAEQIVLKFVIRSLIYKYASLPIHFVISFPFSSHYYKLSESKTYSHVFIDGEGVRSVASSIVYISLNSRP